MPASPGRQPALGGCPNCPTSAYLTWLHRTRLDTPRTGQVYSASEAFVTGTFAGVIPVVEVDGRVIGRGVRGPLTQRLQQLYMGSTEAYTAKGRRVLGDDDE